MARSLAAFLVYAAITAASPFTSSALELRDAEPCGQVAQSLKQDDKIDVNLAFACLRSVPLDNGGTFKMWQTYVNMAYFESDWAYLKKPTPGMLYPPVDVNFGLTDVAKKLDQNYYKNEFDVHFDIAQIMAATHNFHNSYSVDILNVFTWNRPYALASVSKDGISLPDVYSQSDLTPAGKLKDNASPIVQIDDVDVETWLNDYASKMPYDHDPDASYNQIFYDSSDPTRETYGTFASTSYPISNTTSITFANQTSSLFVNYATSDAVWTNVTDGASFFQQFCHYHNASASNTKRTVKRSGTTVVSSSSATATTNNASGTNLLPFASVTPSKNTSPEGPFPAPYLSVEGLRGLAGYLPDSPKDLLVLRLRDFGDADNVDAILLYQNNLRSLLATAQAQGRKRLIIDVRGNYGGVPELALDVFMHIWPSTAPSLTFNQRSTTDVRQMTDSIYQYKANGSSSASRDGSYKNAPFGVFNDTGSPFDMSTYLDKDKHNFTSLGSFYGPFNKDADGDGYTAVLQDRLDTISRPDWIQLPGFLSNTAPIPQVFQAPDIILFTDGICGAACADMAELLKSIANVKSIVVGGRKQMGPMQAVGGSKGRTPMSLHDLQQDLAAAAYSGNTTLGGSIEVMTAPIIGNGLILYQRSQEGHFATINLQNTIRVNDTSLTPTQFVYEAADCRFFYTSAMLANQSLVWQKVYDIVWNGATCVPGSADHPSSLSGKLLSYQAAYPPVGANYTFGAKGQAWPAGIANPASLSTNKIAPTIAPTGGKSLFATSTTYLDGMAATTASSTQPASTATPTSTSSKGGAVMPTAAIGFSGLAGVGVALVAGLAL